MVKYLYRIFNVYFMTPRTKKPVSYHGISLPSSLIEEIKDFIQDKPKYRSVAEFTKEALREKIYSMDRKKMEEEIKQEYHFNVSKGPAQIVPGPISRDLEKHILELTTEIKLISDFIKKEKNTGK